MSVQAGVTASEAEHRTCLVDKEYPKVTIIMPVRNEARFIRRSLDRVLAQDYPGDRLEILVVDGMSDDGTREIIREVISASRNHNEATIRLLDNPSRIVPAALNIGLRHASGDIIFRLDGHSEMATSYIRRCVSRLQERPDVACVAGPSVAVGSGWIGEAYALALRSPFGVGGGTFRTLQTESYVDTLAFGGYRREVFDEVGGFDTELERNQDIEFSSRLRKAGHRLLLIQDTQTFYHGPERLGAILRQNFKNGFWNTRVLDKMLGVLSWRHFVPAVFVASLLATGIAALVFSGGLYLFILVAGSYAIASLLMTASVVLRQRKPSALALPFIFALMHIGYGVGSLVGLGQYLARAGFGLRQKKSA